jgi:hypothetical protein
MAHQLVYEGTPEQLVKHLNRLPTANRYKMTVTSEETTAAPNERALAMLRDIARMKATMQETDGSATDRLLREARAGVYC